MSTTSGATPAEGASKKSRSPVERIVVWGGILLLIGLVAVEYVQRQSHKRVEEALLAKLDAGEADAEIAPLTEADVQKIVGKPVAHTEKLDVGWFPNGAVRTDTYEWVSVNPFRKRELWIYYGIGKNPDVIEIRQQAYEELGPYRPENWPKAAQVEPQQEPGPQAGSTPDE